MDPVDSESPLVPEASGNEPEKRARGASGEDGESRGSRCAKQHDPGHGESAEELLAKRRLQEMMRRKLLTEQAAAAEQAKRQAQLRQMEVQEQRLLQREEEKQKALAFRKELSALQRQSRAFDLERQKRICEQRRLQQAEVLRTKSLRAEALLGERKRSADLRRQAQEDQRLLRQSLRSQALQQRVDSKPDSEKLARSMGSLLRLANESPRSQLGAAKGSAKRECLPRALRRCCNYRSVLAKTDQELPDLPRRVFGFEETIVAEDMDALLPKLHKLLLSWDAYNASVPVFVYFYGGDAHPPYYPHRVANWERGYTEDQLLDVFLALSRRTDTVLEQLKEIWPPPLRAEAGRGFGPEHGLAFLLGDHGEQLTGSDPPPHGNLVSSDVTRTMLALEARAFASQVRRPARRLVRPADVYATVAQLCSLRLQGDLFVGKSLLGEEGHEAINSFSFYRPGDLAAVHFQSADLICSAEFRRPSSGWALHQVDASAVGFGHGKALASQALPEDLPLTHQSASKGRPFLPDAPFV
ncbi:unnamed protein product [Effrenium voratum]|nr:unnamed protein product [Effrenium voratum]